MSEAEDPLDKCNRLMAHLKNRKYKLMSKGITADQIKDDRASRSRKQSSMVLKNGEKGRELRLFNPDGAKG